MGSAQYTKCYQVGGSLSDRDVIYVERQADIDLYESLLRGEYCSVFNSRQMGKSSLLVKVKNKLEQNESYQCLTVDLSKIGSKGITENQWYAGIVHELNKSYADKYDNFLEKCRKNGISDSHIFSAFMEEMVNALDVDQKIVILIDEVDSVERLPFDADDFFHIVRSIYNKRALDKRFENLVFAFFGVSSAEKLVADKSSSPFNIGHSIQLTGFNQRQIYNLKDGLAYISADSENLMDAIAHWTNGQPFLSQKLCMLASESAEMNEIEMHNEWQFINSIVSHHIIENWEENDNPEHLKTIKHRLLHDDHLRVQSLRIYRRLLNGEEVYLDDVAKPCYRHLFLSGLVESDTGQIQIKNRIYKKVFNINWVDHQLSRISPYENKMKAWYESGKNNNAYLLQGEDLELAKKWSRHRRLAEEDYRFIVKSEDVERKRVSKINDTLRKEIRKRELAEKELKSVMGELEAAKRSVELANQDKSQFLSRIEHELKAPINAVLGFGFLAEKHKENEIYIEKITRSARTLKSLVYDITEYRAIQNKELLLNKDVFLLENAIEKVIEINSVDCINSNIKYHLNMPPLLFPSFRGDVFRLKQVLLNFHSLLIDKRNNGDLLFDVISKPISDNKASIFFKIEYRFDSHDDTQSDTCEGGDQIRLALSKKILDIFGATDYEEYRWHRAHGVSFNLQFEVSGQSAVPQSPVLINDRVGVLTSCNETFKSLSHVLSNNGMTVHRYSTEDAHSEDNVDILFLDIYDLNSNIVKNLEKTWLKSKVLLVKNFTRQPQPQPVPSGFSSFEVIDYPCTPRKVLSSIKSISSQHSQFNDSSLKQSSSVVALKPILIVDDDEINREIMRSLIQYMGFPVEAAEDGLAALQMINENDYPLVFLDIEMPKMTGTELVENVKRLNNVVPHFVAVTSHTSKNDKKIFSQIGINDCIAKPFDPDEVLSVIKNHFNLTESYALPDLQHTEAGNKFAFMRHINARKGLKVCMHNEALYDQVLEKFRQSQSDFLQAFFSLLENRPQSDTELIRMAHSLKGLSANIGASKLESASSVLERILKDGVSTDLIKPQLDKVESTLQAVISEITHYQSTMDNTASSKLKEPSDNQYSLPKGFRHLLSTHDISAKDQFLQNESFLANNLSFSDFQNLKNFINDYKFDKALKLFDQVSDSLYGTNEA